MVKIGIIGYGYWGPNLTRNFMSLNNCEVKIVVDQKQNRLDEISKNYPSIEAFSNADEILENSDIDAVVIATPVFTHYDLAKKALLNGKHVLVEKPLTSQVEHAEDLIQLANEKGLTLMVDHTFLYTGAVQKMKELATNGTLGNLSYFDSSRINLGLFQADINVLWDLAPHDISILSYLVKEKPISLNAVGVSHTENGIENIAYLTLNYESNFIAHFNCSWTSPVKIRQTLIGGDEKMIVYNDIEPSEKVRVYDTGYKVNTEDEKNNMLVNYRTGDIFIPKIEGTEALKGVAKDFVSCVKSGKTPISSAELGLEVVKILACAEQSIKNKGQEVLLK